MATALDFLLQKTSAPSELRTAEWDRVPLEVRERAFFMAGVDDAEILDRFRSEAEKMAAGASSLSESRLRMKEFLEAKGYTPEPGTEGTIKDLLSVRRMNVALETNRDMARGYSRWLKQQGALLAFPAREFYRGREARVPRDWQTRWKQALALTTSEGATSGDDEIYVALANHPLWMHPALNRFGTPYTPFDFNSGMTDRAVSRGRAKELGILPGRDASPEVREMITPQSRGLNEGLESRPAIDSPAVREGLAKRLQGFAEWDGDVLKFTDPNGTTPGKPEEVAKVITATMPEDPETGERFPSLQLDALEFFAADPVEFSGETFRDRWADLSRLSARVMPEEKRREFLKQLAEEARDSRAMPGYLGMLSERVITSERWNEATSAGDVAALLKILSEMSF